MDDKVIQLINKCTNDDCVKIVSQNYMISKIIITLFSGIFICLGLFILCKYFVKYSE